MATSEDINLAIDILQAAAVEESPNAEWYIVSHATNDKHRPSAEFQSFIEVRSSERQVQVVFTGRPDERHWRTYRGVAAPRTPSNAPGEADRGDVRLVFRSGAWSAPRHNVDLT